MILSLTAFLIVIAVFFAVDIPNKLKGENQQARNTITVTESGEIYAKPDLAVAIFSVITEGKSVAEALNQNTNKMNAVIEFVKKQGVEEKDLKTTNFSIYPRYEYQQKTQTQIYPYLPGQRVLVGYEVSQSLEVKIRDLTKIGQIIEGAAAAGANQAGDLRFTIDKEDELKAKAREEAIKKAKDKAKELASQLGVRLVRVVNFSESGAMPIFYAAEMKAMSTAGAGGATPHIETGENKITATVAITYEID